MDPAIATVILVDESFETAQLQVAESHVRGVDTDHAATVTINRVFAAPISKRFMTISNRHRASLHLCAAHPQQLDALATAVSISAVLTDFRLIAMRLGSCNQMLRQ
jgi:hypothetical protein